MRAGREVLVALAALECENSTGIRPIVLELGELVEDGMGADAYDFDGDKPRQWTLHGA